MLSFRERLSAVIKALQMPNSEFGRLSGINRVSMTNFLNDKSKPTLETIEKICAVDSRISAEYLIRGVGSPLTTENPESTIEAENKTMLLIFELQSSMNKVLVEYARKVSKEELKDGSFASVR